MHPEALLQSPIDAAQFGRVLDELGPSGRLDTVRRFHARELAALYEAVRGVRPLTLSALVGEDAAPGAVVPFAGKNSLALFSEFQKIFFRTASGVGGRNLMATTIFTGPGYFIAKESADEPGALALDYATPPAEKPADRPALRKPMGIGFLVFGGMVDVLRGVSEHVLIGRAWRFGRATDTYFALCRS